MLQNFNKRIVFAPVFVIILFILALIIWFVLDRDIIGHQPKKEDDKDVVQDFDPGEYELAEVTVEEDFGDRGNVNRIYEEARSSGNFEGQLECPCGDCWRMRQPSSATFLTAYKEMCTPDGWKRTSREWLD